MCFLVLRKHIVDAQFGDFRLVVRYRQIVPIALADEDSSLGAKTGRNSFDQFIPVRVVLPEDVKEPVSRYVNPVGHLVVGQIIRKSDT